MISSPPENWLFTRQTVVYLTFFTTILLQIMTIIFP